MFDHAGKSLPMGSAPCAESAAVPAIPPATALPATLMPCLRKSRRASLCAGATASPYGLGMRVSTVLLLFYFARPRHPITGQRPAIIWQPAAAIRARSFHRMQADHIVLGIEDESDESVLADRKLVLFDAAAGFDHLRGFDCTVLA